MRIFFICFLFSFTYSFQSIDTDEQLKDFIPSSPLNALVFVDKLVCHNEKDDRCIEQQQQLGELRDLCTSEHIPFALSTNIQIAEKQFNIYGPLPKLCFFRDGYPVIYSGSLESIDNIHEWFNEVRERISRTLEDKTFEHDTQAATGSTTGDWFILFKRSNDSRGLLPVWEATSLHFRNRAIFAYVNVDQNPVIQKRFHLFNSPTLILFKRGKMYRYEGSSWKQAAFIDFLEKGYAKVKAEIIPPEASTFSFFENVGKKIPMYLIVIPMICLAVVLLLLVLVGGFTKKKKATTERIPFQVKID